MGQETGDSDKWVTSSQCRVPFSFLTSCFFPPTLNSSYQANTVCFTCENIRLQCHYPQSIPCMHIKIDSSSVAKEPQKERFSNLFIYKIPTLSMGEQMQSLKSPCALFSFLKWTEKDDGEWLKVYAISISFTCPWKGDGNHGFSNPPL